MITINDIIKSSPLVQAAVVEAIHRYYYDHVLDNKWDPEEREYVSNLLSNQWCLLPDWRRILHEKTTRYYKSDIITSLPVWSRPPKILNLSIEVKISTHESNDSGAMTEAAKPVLNTRPQFFKIWLDRIWKYKTFGYHKH